MNIYVTFVLHKAIKASTFALLTSFLPLLLFLGSCADSSLDVDSDEVISSMKFVTIPSGVHTVNTNGRHRKLRLRSSLEVSVFEIKQEEFLAVMGTNPSWHRGANYPDWRDRPVENITIHEARRFCEILNGHNGYSDKNGYRLPTTEEWEYLCRAGTDSDFYTGDLTGDGETCEGSEPSAELAGWYCTNTVDRTHPIGQSKVVGRKQPNNFGLYDMHGNVWERCIGQDLVRGGSWANNPWEARSESTGATAWPHGCKNSSRYIDVGFRIVRTVK